MELYGGSQAAEPSSKTRKKRKKGLGVPTEKLEMLYPRILASLKDSIARNSSSAGI
jgi:hypothetical protein